jgi:hypothetical protein
LPTSQPQPVASPVVAQWVDGVDAGVGEEG